MPDTNIQPNEIDPTKWTLFDKIMYGGLGYGAFCLPSNLFNIIIAVIFPPLGEVINIIGNTVDTELPYFNWEVLKVLLQYNSINRIIYSFLLTTLFYVPGLVYTLTNISDGDSQKLYAENINSLASASNDPSYKEKPKYTAPGGNTPRKTMPGDSSF